MATRRIRPAGAEVGEFASRVLDLTESIPPGRVMTYGDIAEYIGEGGPRQVGRVMALWGGGVPWWRVVHADGSLLSGHEREALRHYRSEGTPLRIGSDGKPARLDLRKARWPAESGPDLARAWTAAGPCRTVAGKPDTPACPTLQRNVGPECWNAIRHG